jgi:hypothetical protein
VIIEKKMEEMGNVHLSVRRHEIVGNIVGII